MKIQEELNFLYVCQSLSWLTFLLKLDKYRGYLHCLMRDLSDFSGNISDILLH